MCRKWGAIGALAPAALVAGATGSCSSPSSCTGFEPPIIRVTNAVTGAPICDARVVAQDAVGDAGAVILKETLPPGDDNLADCQYVGLPTGTFTLSASHANFGMATQSGVTVRSEPCGALGSETPQQIDLALQPQ